MSKSIHYISVEEFLLDPDRVLDLVKPGSRVMITNKDAMMIHADDLRDLENKIGEKDDG